VCNSPLCEASMNGDDGRMSPPRRHLCGSLPAPLHPRRPSMRSLLLGALLAAVVLFVWGFLVWGLMPVDPFLEVTDAPAFTQALTAQLPETGVYLLPAQGRTDEAYAAAVESMRRGPLAMVFFRRAGVEPLSAGFFALGFLHMLVSALIVAGLLRLVAPALPRFGARFAFVALFGLAVGVWARLGEPVWWPIPWDFHLLYFVSDLGSWALAGLVLARFVRSAEPERIRMATA
jgi:hypothetical protein